MKKKGFFAEFKEFAMRGNVIDLAVGVIIGGAFGSITSSLVNDVFMPFIGWLFGSIDLSQLNIVLADAVYEGGEVVKEAVTIGIGTFISAIINFILIAFVIFLFVKGMNKLHDLTSKKKEEEEAAPPEPSKEELLLTEIRDLLKEQKK